MSDTTDEGTRNALSVASVEALPFVRNPTPEEVAAGHKGRIFWTATPSGNWQADCDEGAAWARALLDHMAEHQGRYMLGWVVQAMKAEPRMSGQAVGFLAVFADLARPIRYQGKARNFP